MRAAQIFTPGSFPEFTFVDDHLKDRQTTLTDALETGSHAISISGPSKSGKTVFVERVVGKQNLVQVTGAGVSKPEMLWMRVFDLIGTPLPSITSNEQSFSGTFSGKVSGEADALVAKVNTDIGASGTWGRKENQSETAAIDFLQLLIRELKNTSLVLFIDDFHYVSVDAQKEIARQIKEAIRNGVRIIIASVPYHSDDVVRGNADLRGRIVGIDFDYWDVPTLCRIAEKGFSELNASYTKTCIEKAAAEAAGSPQLMQSLCLNACYEANLRERGTSCQIPNDEAFWVKVNERTALTTDYSSVVVKMSEGPKVRGEARKQYYLVDGTQKDVYPILLLALAQSPPTLTQRYTELTSRVERLIRKGADCPSGSSVIGACFHMSAIANDASGQTIIEWDSENDVIDIQDPYLLFYLRWHNPQHH